MQKICANTWCKQSFEITDDDLAFYERVSPTFAGKKYLIPPPTHCPDCRQQRRLALCNERHFYPATCGLCQKRIITQYPPWQERTVYCRECWHGDDWDSCTYGHDVDFSRPIFEQLKELQNSVPVENLLTAGTVENADYIHYAGFAKNCYLIMHADFCEDCYYGYGFKNVRSCVDGFYNLQSELLYDCIDCHSCYGLKGCQDCRNCHSSAFLRDCIGCKNCFLCVGLREKEFCVENEQLSPDAYRRKIAAMDLRSHAQYTTCKSRRKELELRHPYKEFQGHNLENCSGNHLYNCKNVHASFDCEDVETGKFLYQIVTGAKDIYDCYQYGLKLRESYECCIAGNDTYHALFCHHSHVGCSDLLYCWYIQSSRNCFGCLSVHHKQHCILNKQYSKAEYETLVPKIIEHMKNTGEWGEFFPQSFSTFGYNKTTAQLYYPRTKDQATKDGAIWDEREMPPAQAARAISHSDLPESSKDVLDDIVNCAILCEVSGKPFRIVQQELAFYRNQGLPIPRRSPEQRHIDRLLQRNPRKFWKRQCVKCKTKIQTTYSPERPETVYCEKCYLEAVY